MIQNQFGVQVKILRSDNVAEFINSKCKELFQSLGVIHQSSYPYTLQQNGVVERRHRQILNVARAIGFQSQMPIRIWGLNVTAAIYLINRLPSVSIGGKSPYEMLLCKVLSLT